MAIIKFFPPHKLCAINLLSFSSKHKYSKKRIYHRFRQSALRAGRRIRTHTLKNFQQKKIFAYGTKLFRSAKVRSESNHTQREKDAQLICLCARVLRLQFKGKEKNLSFVNYILVKMFVLLLADMQISSP